MAIARVDNTPTWVKILVWVMAIIWAGLLIGGVFVGFYTNHISVFYLMMIFGVAFFVADMILMLLYATRYIEDNGQAFAEEKAEKAASYRHKYLP